MAGADNNFDDYEHKTLRAEVRAEPRGPVVRTPTLTMVLGPDQGSFVSIDGRNRAMFLGRDVGCDFHIDDPSVSRRHARIYLEAMPGGGEAQVILQDLESTNGSFVNNDAVRRVVLNHGDRIHLGDVLLRFEMLDKEDMDFRHGLARQIEDSDKDPLTGLLSRVAMDEHLPFLLERCEDEELPISAVMLDLDHFKQVNDTRGHSAGDAVLRVAAQILINEVREDDLAIRYGGEEMLLVLAGARRLHARLLAERVREAIAQARFPGLTGLVVTASLGVAERAPGEPVDSWLDRADKALYKAKHRGRNRSEGALPYAG